MKKESLNFLLTSKNYLNFDISEDYFSVLEEDYCRQDYLIDVKDLFLVLENIFKTKVLHLDIYPNTIQVEFELFHIRLTQRNTFLSIVNPTGNCSRKIYSFTKEDFLTLFENKFPSLYTYFPKEKYFK